MARLLIGNRVNDRFAEFEVFVGRDRVQILYRDRIRHGIGAALDLDVDRPADIVVERLFQREELRQRLAVDRDQNIAGR
jgi:hypothetical protein